MALTQGQKDRVARALSDKLLGSCPICMNKQWTFGEDLVLLRTSPELSKPVTGGLARVISGQSGFPSLDEIIAGVTNPVAEMPLLPVMCRVCGNTVLLNVYALGIADVWALGPAGG